MSKKKISDLVEKIDAMGQESEIKGAKWVIEEGKEEGKKEDKIKEVAQEILEDSKRKKITYAGKLRDYIMSQFDKCEIPSGIYYDCKITKKGILVGVRNRNGEWFARGFKVTGEPKYDINAADRFIISALDTIDSWDRNTDTVRVNGEKRTKSGIVLPN